MKYKETTEIIAKSNFLSVVDADFISDSMDQIQNIWAKRQVFRTETEMRISVLNDIKFPTPASKYWQCVRELSVFYENLVILSFDFRENKIEIQKLEKSISEESDPLKKQLLSIKLERKQFSELNMHQVASDRVREIRLWTQLMEELDDGSFNTMDVNDHQLNSYKQRFELQLKNVDKCKISIDEMNNLCGQYKTTLRVNQIKQVE